MANVNKETYELSIGVLYADLLCDASDKANVYALKKRLEDRGMHANIINIPYATNDLSAFLNHIDVLYIGFGSEITQRTILQKLQNEKEAIESYIQAYKPVLAFSGSFTLFGLQLNLNGEMQEGLGILNIDSCASDHKNVGNVKAEISFIQPPAFIYGFENHSCRVNIYKNAPFSKVIHGNGNNANHEDGIIYKNFYGTWMTGGFLPCNPVLTDGLLDICLRHKYKKQIPLAPLDNSIEEEAIKEIAKKFNAKKG